MPVTFTNTGIMAPPGVVLDPATVAWIAAVGSVGTLQQGYVNTLIVGLKSAGIFTKLDRLWLCASENPTQALTDIIADQLATNPASLVHTANLGYQGDGVAGHFLDSQFNPTTAPSPKFGTSPIANCGCIFGWSNTSSTPSVDEGGLVGNDSTCRVYPHFSDNNLYWALNDAGVTPVSPPTTLGLFVSNRDTATTAQLDQNNSTALATNALTASAPVNSNFLALGIYGGALNGKYQLCCWGFGGGLTAGNRADIYSLLRAYMTSVGVP